MQKYVSAVVDVCGSGVAIRIFNAIPQFGDFRYIHNKTLLL
jgi:hypothetical protein